MKKKQDTVLHTEPQTIRTNYTLPLNTPLKTISLMQTTHAQTLTTMEILHIHMKGQKLNTLEQLEVYRYTNPHENNILNKQTQFKSHVQFEHTTQLSFK